MGPIEQKARLIAAGRLLEHTRRSAGLTKSALGRSARVHPRTIRRIELGKLADLPSYHAIGEVFGWEADWFLRAQELDPLGSDDADRLAQLAIEHLALTGWFGPAGLDYLRSLVEYARDAPGRGGRFELLAIGSRQELDAYRARARD